MNIEFNAIYGDVTKKVKVYSPDGMTDHGWHVIVDNYYQGQFINQGGEWCFYPNPKGEEFSSEDIEVMRVKIVEALI